MRRLQKPDKSFLSGSGLPSPSVGSLRVSSISLLDRTFCGNEDAQALRRRLWLLNLDGIDGSSQRRLSSGRKRPIAAGRSGREPRLQEAHRHEAQQKRARRSVDGKFCTASDITPACIWHSVSYRSASSLRIPTSSRSTPNTREARMRRTIRSLGNSLSGARRHHEGILEHRQKTIGARGRRSRGSKFKGIWVQSFCAAAPHLAAAASAPAMRPKTMMSA